MAEAHILLVTFPGQGHINPSIQFTKRLLKFGVKVTMLLPLHAVNAMSKSASTIDGLTLVSHPHDIYDKGWDQSVDFRHFMATLRSSSSAAMADLVQNRAKEGKPISHIVYTTLISWAGEVAHHLNVESTLLWIQPAALLDIYYFYFYGYGEVIREATRDNPIELPGFPLLTDHDLPSFLLKSSPDMYNFALPSMKEHLEVVLQMEEKPRVLVNTFDALEPDGLKAVEKIKMVGVGPLIPSAFLDGRDPSDTSFGGDLLQKSEENYIEWLNSKEESSVVYVAFGSYSEIQKKQMEEIAKGLIESQRPFLWVVREKQMGEEEEQKRLKSREELQKHGLIVPWCSQVEVLQHKSIGCFFSHCGWNSSIESLASGVPVVAFPLWTDQATNAKFIQDVWKTGVRVIPNKEGFVEADEIRRCLDVVGGSEGEEMRKNAKKWKELAREAGKEGGTSHLNLKAFVDKVLEGGH